MVPIKITNFESVRRGDQICGYTVKWAGVQTVLQCQNETECVLPFEITNFLCENRQVVRMVEPEDAITWSDWQGGYSYGVYEGDQVGSIYRSVTGEHNSFTVYDSRFADAIRDKFNNMLFTDEKVES